MLAAQPAPGQVEPSPEELKARQLAREESITARAAQLVHPGSTIAVSADSTNDAFARHLVTLPGLTVVTNSLTVADVLHEARLRGHTVLLTGGLVAAAALVGPMAVAALRSLHIDTVFMGVHGMDIDAGFSASSLLEAETNRAMIDMGRRLVVLADSTKWEVVGPSSMADLSTASVVITDSGLSESAQVALSDRVDDLVLVDPTERPGG